MSCSHLFEMPTVLEEDAVVYMADTPDEFLDYLDQVLSEDVMTETNNVNLQFPESDPPGLAEGSIGSGVVQSSSGQRSGGIDNFGPRLCDANISEPFDPVEISISSNNATNMQESLCSTDFPLDFHNIDPTTHSENDHVLNQFRTSCDPMTPQADSNDCFFDSLGISDDNFERKISEDVIISTHNMLHDYRSACDIDELINGGSPVTNTEPSTLSTDEHKTNSCQKRIAECILKSGNHYFPSSESSILEYQLSERKTNLLFCAEESSSENLGGTETLSHSENTISDEVTNITSRDKITNLNARHEQGNMEDLMTCVNNNIAALQLETVRPDVVVVPKSLASESDGRMIDSPAEGFDKQSGHFVKSNTQTLGGSLSVSDILAAADTLAELDNLEGILDEMGRRESTRHNQSHQTNRQFTSSNKANLTVTQSLSDITKSDKMHLPESHSQSNIRVSPNYTSESRVGFDRTNTTKISHLGKFIKTTVLNSTPAATYRIPPVVANSKQSDLRFALKLWAMLHNYPGSDAISWHEDGTSILLHEHEFGGNAPRMYPGIIRTDRVVSFKRRLNASGFLRVQPTYLMQRHLEAQQGVSRFSHPYFRRGRPDLLGYFMLGEPRDTSGDISGGSSPTFCLRNGNKVHKTTSAGNTTVKIYKSFRIKAVKRAIKIYTRYKLRQRRTIPRKKDRVRKQIRRRRKEVDHDYLPPRGFMEERQNGRNSHFVSQRVLRSRTKVIRMNVPDQHPNQEKTQATKAKTKRVTNQTRVTNHAQITNSTRSKEQHCCRCQCNSKIAQTEPPTTCADSDWLKDSVMVPFILSSCGYLPLKPYGSRKRKSKEAGGKCGKNRGGRPRKRTDNGTAGQCGRSVDMSCSLTDHRDMWLTVKSAMNHIPQEP